MVVEATVNYYFNAYSSLAGAGNWAGGANIIDNDDTTFGEYQDILAGPSTGTAYLSTNTCAGPYLGVITKVEFRWKSFSAEGTTNARPEFNGADLGTIQTADVHLGPAYSSWFDITTDVNAPVWGCNWSNIQNLDLNLSGVSHPPNTYADFYYSQVRVTYVPILPVQCI